MKREENLKVGDRVKLTEEKKMFTRTYEKGHEFTIYGHSFRGFDLIDDEGNKMDECLFIHDKLKKVKQ